MLSSSKCHENATVSEVENRFSMDFLYVIAQITVVKHVFVCSLLDIGDGM